MAVLSRRHRALAFAAVFAAGVVAGAVPATGIASSHPSDLVRADRIVGTVGVVSSGGKAFTVSGAGSFRAFTTAGVGHLRPGERVEVGLVHVAGLEDVVLYVRAT
jgi:hypothetical protein